MNPGNPREGDQGKSLYCERTWERIRAAHRRDPDVIVRGGNDATGWWTAGPADKVEELIGEVRCLLERGAAISREGYLADRHARGLCGPGCEFCVAQGKEPPCV